MLLSMKSIVSLLWESTPQPSNAKDTSTPSTSQGCGKCYNLNLSVYYTNLANMEAMRKEIARLNEIIGEGCMMAMPMFGARRWMNKRNHNTRMEDIPQSRMG